MAGDIFTLDADNNAAVRTVGVKAGAAETNSPIIFTKDADGNAAVRVMGGAGSIDEDRIIIKSAEIPAASEDELGKFYCYSGVTNQIFAHGYVYECVANEPVYTDSVEFVPATLSGTVVTATTGALAGLCATYIQGDITAITNGTLTYDDMSSLWRFVGKDAEDNTVGNFQIYQTDYEDAGFTFTGTPEEGDVVAFTCTITEVGAPYSWVRIDVQPAAKLGRYLSGWNCATGLAVTNPQESPYEYTTGDYFIVKTVATGGAANYRPDGSSYVIGQASTTVETSVVSVGDTYLYDGTSWTLLKTGSTVTSVNSKTGEVVLDATDVGALPLTGGTMTGGITINIPQDAQPLESAQLTFNIMNSNMPTQIISSCIIRYKYLLGVSTLHIGSSIIVSGDILRGSGSDGTIGNATLRWKAICVKKIVNSYTKSIEVPEDVGGTMAVMNTPSTMPELTVAGWDLNTLTGKYEQSVLVDCVTATNNVIISPAPASIDEYLDAGVVCVGQANGRLSFEADSLPNSAVTVNLICFN